MLWEVRIKYADGSQQILRTCKNQETALRCVDVIYARGYPLHLAYFACPAAKNALMPT